MLKIYITYIQNTVIYHLCLKAHDNPLATGNYRENVICSSLTSTNNKEICIRDFLLILKRMLQNY